MQVPPDNEIVFVCHCNPNKPGGAAPVQLVQGNSNYQLIRKVSDKAHFVDTSCDIEGNRWIDVPDGSIEVIMPIGCPIYPLLMGLDFGKELEDNFKEILENARRKLKPNGKFVINVPSRRIDFDIYGNYKLGPGWKKELREEFPFTWSKIGKEPPNNIGYVVFTKTGGGRRKTRRRKSRRRT